MFVFPWSSAGLLECNHVKGHGVDLQVPPGLTCVALMAIWYSGAGKGDSKGRNRGRGYVFICSCKWAWRRLVLVCWPLRQSCGEQIHQHNWHTYAQKHSNTHTHTQRHTSEDLALSAPSKLGCRESISPLLHLLLPLLLALCTDPERMSSPSALMPRCRVKHQEKLYYTKTGERRWRGTEQAGGKERIRETGTEVGREGSHTKWRGQKYGRASGSADL